MITFTDQANAGNACRKRVFDRKTVTTNDQDFTLQEQALRAAGCEVIRAEKVTGTSRTGRTELQVLLDFLRS
ncbi:MAG: hypothetical protein Q7U66_05285, partial [Methylobacter sp.]|nr:hypothetical protein [Methylobacter sp.]